MDELAIALDVGGTAIKAALLRADGTAVHETSMPTGAGPKSAVDTILQVAEALAERAVELAGAPAVAAGVAVPGVVDEAAGIAVNSANLRWRDVPLRDLLTTRLRLPVAVGHDVRAGGVAEARLGAGRGCPLFLFVPVGTGIAAAVAIDGRVVSGAHGRAGELGHLVARPDGPLCACGRRGCVEAIASAAAIARRYAVAGGDAVSAEQVAARAAAGEERAQRVWSEAVGALADGMLDAVTLFDPDLIAVGGGLARSGEQLLAPLRTALARRLTFESMPRIVPAELGYRASCLGAGLLAFDLAAAG